MNNRPALDVFEYIPQNVFDFYPGGNFRYRRTGQTVTMNISHILYEQNVLNHDADLWGIIQQNIGLNDQGNSANIKADFCMRLSNNDFLITENKPYQNSEYTYWQPKVYMHTSHNINDNMNSHCRFLLMHPLETNWKIIEGAIGNTVIYPKANFGILLWEDIVLSMHNAGFVFPDINNTEPWPVTDCKDELVRWVENY
ncbi:MAG: hypothetical protein GY795_47225 [Desulfobacterales bacterium]|nr:hypothetical protein [Desulfobacterales bacterium]